MIFEPEALSRCVGCGLCLPSCPTFQLTHAEQHGPRGRIAGMRLAQSGEIAITDTAFRESMETCVQCRACEPACPSGVRFGALMEQARVALRENGAQPAAARRRGATARLADVALDGIASRPLLAAATALLSFAQALRVDRVLPATLRPARRIRLRDAFRPLRAARGARPAHLFRGCVMDAWFRPVHAATLRVLAAAGYAVGVQPAGCCGALHLHAGRVERARRLAARVVAAYSGTTGDVIVNSAGCGAAMREYGLLLGTEEAKAFAARVRDFSEAVIAGDLPPLEPRPGAVAWQAACHLRNVQRVDVAAERLLGRIPGLVVRRPDDGELCCGAGGAYALVEPEFASRMRERKRQALQDTGAPLTASSNPGCMLHLEGAGVPMVHVAQLVAEALPAARPAPDARAARRNGAIA